MLAAKLNVDASTIALFASRDLSLVLSDHTSQYSNDLLISDSVAKLLADGVLVFGVRPEWATQIQTGLATSLQWWSVKDELVMMPSQVGKPDQPGRAVSHKCFVCSVKHDVDFANPANPEPTQHAQPHILPEQICAFDVCKLHICAPAGMYMFFGRIVQFVLPKLVRINLIAMRFDGVGFAHIDWSAIPNVAHLECQSTMDLAWPTSHGFASISARDCKTITMDVLCRYTSLTHLKLHHCCMQASIPANICHLVQLQTLEMCNCDLLGSIPDELNQLTNLVEINLSNNRLGGMLPNLDSLVNLESIDLMRNKPFDNVLQTQHLTKLKVCNIPVNVNLRGFVDSNGKTLYPCRSFVPENMSGIQAFNTFGTVSHQHQHHQPGLFHRHLY